MNRKTENFIKALEKQLVKEFGIETIFSTEGTWNDRKAKRLAEQEIEWYRRLNGDNPSSETVLKDGIEIKGFRERHDPRVCRFCKKFSFRVGDAAYLTAYGCCEYCYVVKILDRQKPETEPTPTSPTTN